MSNRPAVVIGEASETESEDESNHSSKMALKRETPVQGAAIAGEASESEDENGSSISSAVSAHPSIMSISINQETGSDDKVESLLIRKLKECNKAFQKDLNTFVHTTVTAATKNLVATDHQLLQSQVTLQSAISSLRSLNQHSAVLKSKLENVLSSKFLSNMRVPCK